MENKKVVPRRWKDIVFVGDHMTPNNEGKPNGSSYYLDLEVAEAIELLTTL